MQSDERGLRDIAEEEAEKVRKNRRGGKRKGEERIGEEGKGEKRNEEKRKGELQLCM